MIRMLIATPVVAIASGLFWGALGRIAIASNAYDAWIVPIIVIIGAMSTTAAYFLLLPLKED